MMNEQPQQVWAARREQDRESASEWVRDREKGQREAMSPLACAVATKEGRTGRKCSKKVSSVVASGKLGLCLEIDFRIGSARIFKTNTSYLATHHEWKGAMSARRPKK